MGKRISFSLQNNALNNNNKNGRIRDSQFCKYHKNIQFSEKNIELNYYVKVK